MGIENTSREFDGEVGNESGGHLVSSVGVMSACHHGVPTVKPGVSQESRTSPRSLPAVVRSVENPEEVVFSRKVQVC